MTISTSGNVGVGTTSPLWPLHVYRSGIGAGLTLESDAAANGGGQYIAFKNAGAVIGLVGPEYVNDDMWLTALGARNVRFETNAIERMRITSAGNVGIGTTAPGANLHVSGNGGGAWDSSGVIVENSNSDTSLHFRNTSAGGRNYSLLAGGTGSTVPSALRIFDATAGAERMVITSSGNIGIGTTTPTALLSLGSGVANGKLHLWEHATTPYGLGIQSNEFRLFVGAPTADFRFYDATAGNALMTIKGSGNVGIGTTSPAAKLQVSGQIASTMPSTLTPTGTTQTVDFSTGNVQALSLASATGTVTLTLSNAVAGGAYAIKIIQGATARTLSWPAAVKWPSGTPITLSTASGAVDLVSIFYDGTNYYAVGGNNFQ
jgi:hypothetical protein